MKKFIVADSGSVGIDTETEEVFSLETQREAISRIYMAQEPMTIVVKRYGKEYELNANKNDIIISFYDADFDKPVIVVSNEDWINNLNVYNEKMQKRKEECAVKCADCDCCECKSC